MRFFVPLYLSEEEIRKPVKVGAKVQLYKRRKPAMEQLTEMSPKGDRNVPVIAVVACRSIGIWGQYHTRSSCTAYELFFPDKTLIAAMRAEKVMLRPGLFKVLPPGLGNEIRLAEYAKADAVATLNLYTHFFEHKTVSVPCPTMHQSMPCAACSALQGAAP